MAFRAKDLQPDLDCVVGGSTEDCVAMIRYGDADMMTLDAGDLYHAGKDHGLVPIAQEDYGDMTGGFYVLAAARKPDSYLTLFNLKGKRSCHGSVRTGDGWFVPVSILIETTQIRPESCNICENVDGGDVAFVRHLTIRINTDGRNAAIWARNRRSDDYEIMCKDGSRTQVRQGERNLLESSELCSTIFLV